MSTASCGRCRDADRIRGRQRLRRAIGIAFFRVRALREMIFPIFIVSQTIPVIAFGALVVLWFGNTLLAKAVIAFYLTFFPVTVNTLLGLETVDPQAGGADAQLRRLRTASCC